MSNEKFDLIDELINVLTSFKNLGKNISNEEFNKELNSALTELHAHMKAQDDKINKILEVITNDENK